MSSIKLLETLPGCDFISELEEIQRDEEVSRLFWLNIFAFQKPHTQGHITAPLWILGMQNIHYHTYPNTSEHVHTSVHQDWLLT